MQRRPPKAVDLVKRRKDQGMGAAVGIGKKEYFHGPRCIEQPFRNRKLKTVDVNLERGSHLQECSVFPIVRRCSFMTVKDEHGRHERETIKEGGSDVTYTVPFKCSSMALFNPSKLQCLHRKRVKRLDILEGLSFSSTRSRSALLRVVDMIWPKWLWSSLYPSYGVQHKHMSEDLGC